MLFKPSYLSSNFALTVGYLNPASNNPAQENYSPPFGGVARIHARAARNRRRPSQLRRLLACFLAINGELGRKLGKLLTSDRGPSSLPIIHFFIFFSAFLRVAIESPEEASKE